MPKATHSSTCLIFLHSHCPHCSVSSYSVQTEPPAYLGDHIRINSRRMWKVWEALSPPGESDPNTFDVRIDKKMNRCYSPPLSCTSAWNWPWYWATIVWFSFPCHWSCTVLPIPRFSLPFPPAERSFHHMCLPSSAYSWYLARRRVAYPPMFRKATCILRCNCFLLGAGYMIYPQYLGMCACFGANRRFWRVSMKVGFRGITNQEMFCTLPKRLQRHEKTNPFFRCHDPWHKTVRQLPHINIIRHQF